MRSWYPIAPEQLDRKRLLGEHLELHIMYNVILKKLRGEKGGYQHHPEVIRWQHHLPALIQRHNDIVIEMINRGYNHKSALEPIDGDIVWPNVIEPLDVMLKKLQDKIMGA